MWSHCCISWTTPPGDVSGWSKVDLCRDDPGVGQFYLHKSFCGGEGSLTVIYKSHVCESELTGVVHNVVKMKRSNRGESPQTIPADTATWTFHGEPMAAQRGICQNTDTLLQENWDLSECHIGFLGGSKICLNKGLTSCCTPKPVAYCMYFWPQALIPLWLVKGCSSSACQLWKNKESVKGTYVWPFLADAKNTYHPVTHLKKWHSFSLVNDSTAETIWFITKLWFHELH